MHCGESNSSKSPPSLHRPYLVWKSFWHFPWKPLLSGECAGQRQRVGLFSLWTAPSLWQTGWTWPPAAAWQPTMIEICYIICNNLHFVFNSEMLHTCPRFASSSEHSVKSFPRHRLRHHGDVCCTLHKIMFSHSWRCDLTCWAVC